uniref:C2 domain-containing protein n=1 Tax=Biomphalaria glabrata TaxID=6526 RepID=A0A2C9LKC7_BIOGL
MTPQEENLGELHVALMYLPTAEKLSVILLSAKNLRPIEGAKRNIEIFAKITLMHDGRPLKKTKTSGKASDLSPVFNETFVFDVPVYQLDKVYFSFAIIGVDKVRKHLCM